MNRPYPLSTLNEPIAALDAVARHKPAASLASVLPWILTKLPVLFERFVRGDSSRSHAAGSTGLGLAIVEAVTAAHGGSVGVTSRPGRTSFVITLPGLEGPLTARDGPPPAPGAAADGTVSRHT